MGSLTALLLRALFDTALTVNNVVVKLLAPAAAATLTCKSMRVVTSPDAWRESLRVPPAITSPLGPHAWLGALRGSSWDARRSLRATRPAAVCTQVCTLAVCYLMAIDRGTMLDRQHALTCHADQLRFHSHKASVHAHRPAAARRFQAQSEPFVRAAPGVLAQKGARGQAYVCVARRRCRAPGGGAAGLPAAAATCAGHRGACGRRARLRMPLRRSRDRPSHIFHLL